MDEEGNPFFKYTSTNNNNNGGSGDNPFDQTLNTTDTVTFNVINTNHINSGSILTGTALSNKDKDDINNDQEFVTKSYCDNNNNDGNSFEWLPSNPVTESPGLVTNSGNTGFSYTDTPSSSMADIIRVINSNVETVVFSGEYTKIRNELYCTKITTGINKPYTQYTNTSIERHAGTSNEVMSEVVYQNMNPNITIKNPDSTKSLTISNNSGLVSLKNGNSSLILNNIYIEPTSSLIPSLNNTIDLGSSDKIFRNIYTNSQHVENDITFKWQSNTGKISGEYGGLDLRTDNTSGQIPANITLGIANTTAIEIQYNQSTFGVAGTDVLTMFQNYCNVNVPVVSNQTTFSNSELITKQEAIRLLGSQGQTSIYSIEPFGDSTVQGVSVITNYVKQSSSDEDINVGCRRSGATFVFTKKGKFLLQLKNFYQFQNNQNNYVSQYMLTNSGREYMVSSKETSGNQNDANVISSMVFDANVNTQMTMCSYTSSAANMNTYANGHDNFGRLTITLLKDDNVITNSINYTPSEILLNRISELEAKHDTLNDTFQTYQSEQNLLNLEDEVADLSTFSSLQTAVLNLTTALNDLKTKFETLTTC